MRAAPASGRTVGLLGLGSIAVMFGTSVTTAAAYSGWTGESYSPLNHFISELGEVGTSRLALVFNLGILLGSLGLGLFFMLLSRRLTGRYRAAMVVAGILAGVSGSLVGVFPMDTHALHRATSGIFFTTGWLVAAIFSQWLLAAPRPGFSRLLLVPGGLAVMTFAAFLAVYTTYRPADQDAHILARAAVWSVPLLEWAALLSLLLWIACVSIALLASRLT